MKEPAMPPASNPPQQIAALFDFDETLLAIDSSGIGFKLLKEQGYLSRWFIFKMILTLFLKKIGLVNELFMARVFLGFYKHRELQEFKDSADRFYEEYLHPNLAPQVVQKLRWHQEQGHHTVLVSGSIDYYLRPVQKDLGIDDLLCTHLEEDATGLLTGKAQGPVCVGENKVVLTHELAIERNLDLANSYAYGNSVLDIPIMEAVGYPVAVTPDSGLTRHAKSRGWDILT